MITLQDAVDDLYRLTVIEKRRTSTRRLDVLADYCVQELSNRGLSGATKEVRIPGIGRTKSWDVAWPECGKIKFGISLKSLLKNIAGTVPNRADDLMGEMANVQLWSPEIVTGYVAVFDVSASKIRSDGTRWVDFFRSTIERLSGRDAPAWAAGMVEASAIVEVDFSSRPMIARSPDMSSFFDELRTRVVERNPEIQRRKQP
ncbi:MAG: hypothetical protein F4X97_12640 [Boseongicola sp. SB0662_bin_57]|nr:hypothetical protein [Boseongicola sp. SB0662_bin_57]